MFDLEQEGENVLKLIKEASWFPYKKGNLRDKATSGNLVDDKTYLITFSEEIAPYVTYLEEGTKPHNILGAFGNYGYWQPYAFEGDLTTLPFGVGGRFDGKFHPGSTKHKGFISDKSVNAITQYFINKYKGQLK